MTSPARDEPLELPGPFRFESATVEGAQIRLRYAIGSAVEFEETVDFPFPLPHAAAIEHAVDVLHLVAGVSYYKCVAPRRLESPALDSDRRALVHALYDEGLRELAVTNGLPVPLPVDLDEGRPTNAAPLTAPAELAGALVPIGGGKDSALVADLVPDGTLLAVNPVGAHERLAEHLDRPLVRVQRHLDPQLRELVARGAPNGHVPVTAINSAVAVVAALALGRRDVLIGLERSASEPTVIVDGVPVNHQFSKSSDAEELLRRVFAPLGVRYFSILRPFTELAIGTAVAERGLTDGIVSCNRAFTMWSDNDASRTQRPCGECAKCLFTSLMLAPSLEPADIRAHFGRDLLDEPEHIQAVRDLWSDAKPFDCVGERLETAAAVALLAEQPAWRDQAVVAALAPEADALLAAGEADPHEFLVADDPSDLPDDYRDRVARLADEIRPHRVGDEA
jgi:hypothetical protein